MLSALSQAWCVPDMERHLLLLQAQLPLEEAGHEGWTAPESDPKQNSPTLFFDCFFIIFCLISDYMLEFSLLFKRKASAFQP